MLLVEPRPFMRECLSRLLQASARNFRVVTVSDPAAVADKGACSGGADLILINIGGAGVSEGWAAETIALLGRVLPDVPITVLADREDAEHVVEALCRGVRGYIPTSLPFSAVVEALRFVRAGGTFAPASAVVQPAKPERTEGEGCPPAGAAATGAGVFTARELEVLTLLRWGKSNKLIAYDLGMQESTLKVHVRNIKRKLRVTNRTEAALLAHRLFEDQGRAADSGDPAV